MKIKSIVLIIGAISVLALGCNEKAATENENINSQQNQNNSNPPADESSSTQTVDFSQYNSIYKFSADIPSDWKVEYVGSIESINIYAPNLARNNALERSVIFIRNFSANDFLTLQTVNILSRESTKIDERAAVRYEIEKKAGVANFPSQPSWRNGRHKLIDIRYTVESPSPFYVFAHNPELPDKEFNDFISSLEFK